MCCLADSSNPEARQSLNPGPKPLTQHVGARSGWTFRSIGIFKRTERHRKCEAQPIPQSGLELGITLEHISDPVQTHILAGIHKEYDIFSHLRSNVATK